jgi:DNA segregation ATPase FtsK/SpoIIIE, S-DNA-T family
MSDIDTLNAALKNLKLDATAVEERSTPPYHKFWVQLGAEGTLKKLETKAVEIGLAMRASAPICTPNFENGTVCLEMLEGTHPLVNFDELAASSGFSDPSKVLGKYELPILLGTTDVANPLIVDLVDFPHILLAGTTGSGKSVSEHCIIRSLAMHADKNKVRLCLADPKFVEFSSYHKLESLKYDVATEPEQIEAMLVDLTEEMDKRLRLLHKAGCRDLKEYRAKTGKGSYIVLVIDELSDLMATTKKRFEEALCRLAQKARAAGIHIVAATQYPHSDVLTGKIKANFSGRICFQVTDPAHSRVMLGDNNSGAVFLQGKGDAYLSGSKYSMQRFRGALVNVAAPQPSLLARVFGAVSNTIA